MPLEAITTQQHSARLCTIKVAENASLAWLRQPCIVGAYFVSARRIRILLSTPFDWEAANKIKQSAQSEVTDVVPDVRVAWKHCALSHCHEQTCTDVSTPSANSTPPCEGFISNEGTTKRRKRARHSSEQQFEPTAESHPVIPLHSLQRCSSSSQPMPAIDSSKEPINYAKCTNDILEAAPKERSRCLRDLPPRAGELFVQVVATAPKSFDAAIDDDERKFWLCAIFLAPRLLLVPARGGARGVAGIEHRLAGSSSWKDGISMMVSHSKSLQFNRKTSSEAAKQQLASGHWRSAFKILKGKNEIDINTHTVNAVKEMHPHRYEETFRQPDSHGYHASHDSQSWITKNDIDKRLHKCRKRKYCGICGWTRELFSLLWQEPSTKGILLEILNRIALDKLPDEVSLLLGTGVGYSCTEERRLSTSHCAFANSSCSWFSGLRSCIFRNLLLSMPFRWHIRYKRP